MTPWTAARQASLYITNSWSLLKLMSIESVMSSNHLILCHPLLLMPPIFPSIRVFSSESALRIRWSKYWSSSFSISPSNEYSGLISFKIDWFDLLAKAKKKKKLSIFKNFEMLENFRKVERIVQWIPTYPSHMFTNVILPCLLYVYLSIYLLFSIYLFTESFESTEIMLQRLWYFTPKYVS